MAKRRRRQRKNPPRKGNWFCYLLISENKKRTYVGKTNDIVRRLRQHNGIIKGGANATHSNRPWRFALVTMGFTDEIQAMQFEWRMHHPPTRRFGLDGRLKSLSEICLLPKWTSRAPESEKVPLKIFCFCSDVYKKMRGHALPKHVKLVCHKKSTR